MVQAITQDFKQIIETLNKAGDYHFNNLLKKCHIVLYTSPYGFSTYFHKPTNTSLVFQNNLKTTLRYKYIKLFELKELVKDTKLKRKAQK